MASSRYHYVPDIHSFNTRTPFHTHTHTCRHGDECMCVCVCLCWRSWNQSRFSLATNTNIASLVRAIACATTEQHSVKYKKNLENKIMRWQQNRSIRRRRSVCGDLKCKFNRARTSTHIHTHTGSIYPRRMAVELQNAIFLIQMCNRIRNEWNVMFIVCVRAISRDKKSTEWEFSLSTSISSMQTIFALFFCWCSALGNHTTTYCPYMYAMNQSLKQGNFLITRFQETTLMRHFSTERATFPR